MKSYVTLSFATNHVQVTPTSYSFKNVSYSITAKKKETILLSDVSGHVPAGKLLAIMGPSGAGKTTLLDVLAGRNKIGTAIGNFQVNGHPRPVNFHRHCGYVMQEGVFLETLTVRETLLYSLELRKDDDELEEENPPQEILENSPKLPLLPRQQKLQNRFIQKRQEIVDEILKTLNLTKVADTRIGDPLKRGISGGERRRLSIAVELVVSPSIIFMDEPTTGLDARNAFQVMKAARELCHKGHTVICTIHQPRSNIFKMFDYLLLLNHGSTVYFGPAADAVKYFGSIGITCPKSINPADFLLDILDTEFNARDIGSAVFNSSFDISVLPAVFKLSEQNKKLMEQISTKRRSKLRDSNNVLDDVNGGSSSSYYNNSDDTQKQPPFMEEYAISGIKQYSILTRRTWLATSRDTAIIFIRTLAAIVIALLIGSIFYGEPDDTSGAGARVNTLLFMMCVFSMFPVPAIGKFVKDRHLFVTEKASGYYSTAAFFFAWLSVEVPILMGIVVGYGCISYWMVGLNPSIPHFLFFLAQVFVVLIIGFSMSQVISAAFKSVNLAIAIYMILLVYSLLLGGFIVRRNKLNNSVKWLTYTSYIWWGYQGLVINEFEDKWFGEPLLVNLGMDGGDKYVNLGILCCIWIFLQSIAFILLSWFTKEKT